MKHIHKYFNKDIVIESLANTEQITFEVTDLCNLNCTYCGYGDFYSNHDARDNKMLSIEKAVIFFDYMSKLWNSPYNKSDMKNIYISFYGGEPLMNMKFIKDIIHYLENMNSRHRTFTFSMTTNAMLLNRYMDFLASKKIQLLISLDGDRYNMNYRLDKSGNSAFDKIIRNIDLLKDKHPEYFEKYVKFNSVLHNKNSVEEIHSFFKKKYGKMPQINSLNTTGIREDKKIEFENTYKDVAESLNNSEHYPEIIKDMSEKLGIYKSISNYLVQYSDFIFYDYNELLNGKQTVYPLPTGTCMPFNKKVYMTVNGKLLPCERIGHQFALGYVDNNIVIDFQDIADKYNTYYAKVDAQCKKCYNKRTCLQCIFHIPDIDNEKVICHGYMNKREFKQYKDAQMGFLAKNPDEYYRFLVPN